jgi:hypothetical protein
MTNPFRCAGFSRVAGIVFAVLALSVGKPNIAQAEHAASPHESAAAAALSCFETWLDRPADFIAAVECMYKAWQTASCNHSRISTASLVKVVATSPSMTNGLDGTRANRPTSMLRCSQRRLGHLEAEDRDRQRSYSALLVPRLPAMHDVLEFAKAAQ